MKSSLFIGNGLNRSIISNIAWNDLLQNIAEEYGVLHNTNISFPLEFESIANQILKAASTPSPDIYLDLKKKIIQQIDKAVLPMAAPHYAFTKLPVDSIFTTNYDYLVENSLNPEFNCANYPDTANMSNNRYNLKANRKIVGKTIYHVHGELKKPRTICLGYEHYAGTLQNMRTELNTESKESGLLIRAALLDAGKSTNTWAEKFFSNNVDIIGFGLAQCEIDIWWLLTYRAYLFYSDRDGMRKLINNTITFHDVGTEPDPNMKYALENIHVQYQFHKLVQPISDEFYAAYLNIAEELKDKIESYN